MKQEDDNSLVAYCIDIVVRHSEIDVVLGSFRSGCLSIHRRCGVTVGKFISEWPIVTVVGYRLQKRPSFYSSERLELPSFCFQFAGFFILLISKVICKGFEKHDSICKIS